MGMQLGGGLNVCGDRIMIGFKTQNEKSLTRKKNENLSSAFEKIKARHPFHFKVYSDSKDVWKLMYIYKKKEILFPSNQIK